MRTSTSTSDRITTSLKWERELYDGFREVAYANHRTVAAELRWLAERHIDQHRRAQERKQS